MQHEHRSLGSLWLLFKSGLHVRRQHKHNSKHKHKQSRTNTSTSTSSQAQERVNLDDASASTRTSASSSTRTRTSRNRSRGTIKDACVYIAPVHVLFLTGVVRVNQLLVFFMDQWSINEKHNDQWSIGATWISGYFNVTPSNRLLKLCLTLEHKFKSKSLFPLQTDLFMARARACVILQLVQVKKFEISSP